MKSSTCKLLEKPERAIVAAAEFLAGHGFTEFAIARAYYAMFYVVEGLLGEAHMHFRKHGGVHSAFGEYYVKTGRFDVRFHR